MANSKLRVWAIESATELFAAFHDISATRYTCVPGGWACMLVGGWVCMLVGLR